MEFVHTSERVTVTMSLCPLVHIQLLLALRYIHKDRHIIHRDLTASNVMVTNEAHLMLSEYLLVTANT